MNTVINWGQKPNCVNEAFEVTDQTWVWSYKGGEGGGGGGRGVVMNLQDGPSWRMGRGLGRSASGNTECRAPS